MITLKTGHTSTKSPSISPYSDKSNTEYLIQKWKSKQPSRCCVCLDTSMHMQKNLLIKCSTVDCDVCVHQQCYGVISMPLDISQWRCDGCVAGPADDNECALCPSRGGALKLDKTGKAWVHVVCAIWNPEVSIGSSLKMDDIDLSNISMASSSLYCYLCRDIDSIGCGVGACLPCSADGCLRSFHATCAMRWNILKDSKINGSTGGFDCFCHEHASSCEFPVNEWEHWRMNRDNFKDLALLGDDNMELDSSPPVDLHEQKRLRDVSDMIQRNDKLFADRESMELQIIESTKNSQRMASQISVLSAENDKIASDFTIIQRMLLRVFQKTVGMNLQWDQLYLNNTGSIEQVPPSNNFIEFFLKFNQFAFADYQQIDHADVIPPLDTLAAMILTSNLSTKCKLPTINPPPSTYSRKKTNSTGCSKCKHHNLPPTAPVMAKFRNYLLACARCEARWHLCCLPEPLASIDDAEAKWWCNTCKPAILQSMGTSRRNDLRISSSVSSFTVSEEEDEYAETIPKKKIRRAPVDSPGLMQQSPLKAQGSKKKSSNSTANYVSIKPKNFSSSFGATYAFGKPKNSTSNNGFSKPKNFGGLPSPVQPKLDDNAVYDLENERYLLRQITGDQPQLPASLARIQQLEDRSDAFLRGFVFETVPNEDWDEMRLVAMWRTISNVPPGASARDIHALRLEGEQFNYGKFAQAFHINDKKTDDCGAIDQEPPVIESNVSSPLSGCDHAMLPASESETADGSDEEFQLVESKRSSSSTSQNHLPKQSKSGLRPERVPSRWNGDLYKPIWTRGNGKLKEGWCALCEPGQWLKTKTSVYWYHMHNYHGISSIAGNFFDSPLDHRVSSVNNLKEGLCGHCNKWIPIQGDKPVNVEEIYWFKHAQKCHKFDEME
eukprot:Partr_v1_DN28360_c3_g3_i4_m78891 putative PHD finger protein